MHKYKFLTELGKTSEAEFDAQTAEEQKAYLEDSEKKSNYRSCAIEEIKMKIMDEPEKHKASSVFIASKAQLEKAKKLEE